MTGLRVAVVGGGIGGLAAAIRLRTAGHAVTLLERNAVLGGKVAELHDDGHTFDLGPSLVTLPHVFDEVLALAGTRLADEVELVRLDPQFRYHWRDGASLTVADDADATAGAFDAFDRGAGDAWRRFDAYGRRIWDVSERTFLAGPMSGPLELLRRLRSPHDLTDIDPLRTLHAAAGDHFRDPRLVQWAGRYATYSGSSPFRAPATLACIPHIEARFGCWYPTGGVGALRDALARAADRVGVDLRTGTEVLSVDTDLSGRVRGVALSGGRGVPADVVVANVDAEHLYGELLRDERALARVRRAERSTSGVVVCVAVDRRTGAGHHTVWFSGDERREFDQLAAGRLPDDPTVYACVSVVSDPSQAPAGEENWYLLVNAPAGLVVDRAQAAGVVLDALDRHGLDLRAAGRVVATLVPADLAARFRAPGGAIYGTSSNGRRAAFVRPANRGARRGLYLAGGSSHPGGGLPLVVTSARIVADLVERDLAAGGRSALTR
jgi:phytoene desaturase